MLRDLERARMEREDFRQGNAPHPGSPQNSVGAILTWRKEYDYLLSEVAECVEALEDVRALSRDNTCSLEIRMDRIFHMTIPWED